MWGEERVDGKWWNVWGDSGWVWRTLEGVEDGGEQYRAETGQLG